MTFVVNQQGKVFQKNLGPKTADARAGDHALRPRRELDGGHGVTQPAHPAVGAASIRG